MNRRDFLGSLVAAIVAPAIAQAEKLPDPSIQDQVLALGESLTQTVMNAKHTGVMDLQGYAKLIAEHVRPYSDEAIQIYLDALKDFNPTMHALVVNELKSNGQT